MATFKINQSDNNIIIFTQGEVTQAEVYKRDGQKADGSPNFVNTGEPKFTDEDKTIPVWNVPASILMGGVARQLATKLVIESSTKPETLPNNTMAIAVGLRVDTNGRFFADALHAPGNQGSKFGGESK